MRYVAHIEVDTNTPITEDQLFAVAAIGGGASGRVDEPHVGTTFGVCARNPAAALALAVARVRKAVGVPVSVRSVEIVTEDEEDRRLTEPAFPELVGVAEAAKRLGVSKQRVSTLQGRPGFPAPVAVLSSGPVWRAGDLTRFDEEWDRKPGRPKRLVTEGAA